MPTPPRLRTLPARWRILLLGLGGCAIPVENENLPDRTRLFSDPATIQLSLTGAVRTWVNNRQGGATTMVVATMADSYSSGWNNFGMRFYSAEPRIEWGNISSGLTGAVERAWYSSYASMSTANAKLSTSFIQPLANRVYSAGCPLLVGLALEKGLDLGLFGQ